VLGYAVIMPIAMAIATVMRCAAGGCPRDLFLPLVMSAVRGTFGTSYLAWNLTHAAMIAVVAGMFGYAMDKAHRRERALLQAQVDKYHEAIEKLDFGFYRTTLDGRFLLVNAKFADMLGYDSIDELMAAPAASLYAADSGRDRFLAQLREKGYVHQKEFLLATKDGRPLVVTDDAHLVGNTITGIISPVETTSDRYIISICAYCNMLRDGSAEDAAWVTPPVYFHNHVKEIKDSAHQIAFSHGICPTCAKREIDAIR